MYHTYYIKYTSQQNSHTGMYKDTSRNNARMCRALPFFFQLIKIKICNVWKKTIIIFIADIEFLMLCIIVWKIYEEPSCYNEC